jgi:hypothetical protein
LCAQQYVQQQQQQQQQQSQQQGVANSAAAEPLAAAATAGAAQNVQLCNTSMLTAAEGLAVQAAPAHLTNIAPYPHAGTPANAPLETGPHSYSTSFANQYAHPAASSAGEEAGRGTNSTFHQYYPSHTSGPSPIFGSSSMPPYSTCAVASVPMAAVPTVPPSTSARPPPFFGAAAHAIAPSIVPSSNASAYHSAGNLYSKIYDAEHKVTNA